MGMVRRKASPEQLIMLLRFLENDKELAIGKLSGLESRIYHTKAWIKITEKLNANSGLTSGAIKTPTKWQQTWRDLRNNIKKKALRIRKNRCPPGLNASSQLTEAEEKILRLIWPKTSVLGLSDVPETIANSSLMDTAQSSATNDDICNQDLSTNNMKWPSDPEPFTQSNIVISLEDGLNADPDTGMETNGVSSAPITEKPLWKRGRPVKLVHDRLLNLEEEKIRIEKQKLLEKKRCNNIRLKIEKDRLEIEKQRNVLLEKLLVAVEAVAQR